MPDPREQGRKADEAAPFRVGDVVLVVSRQATGPVRKVEMERQMLKVSIPQELIEVPFADAQVIDRAPPPRGSRGRRPPFRQGEVVRVIGGAFADFNGVVEEVFADRERLRVAVLVFGRATPTELAFAEVERS